MNVMKIMLDVPKQGRSLKTFFLAKLTSNQMFTFLVTCTKLTNQRKIALKRTLKDIFAFIGFHCMYYFFAKEYIHENHEMRNDYYRNKCKLYFRNRSAGGSFLPASLNLA